MPRAPHKYHYIYKTTCLTTNKFYIGVHSTSNLEDGYKGSGTVLRRSINKYGKDNHITIVLEFLPNREDLFIREKEIVNEEMISDPLCMNLVSGGGGNVISPGNGWKKINETYWKDPINRARQIERGKTLCTGHTEATREKMSKTRKGKTREFKPLIKETMCEGCNQVYSNRGLKRHICKGIKNKIK